MRRFLVAMGAAVLVAISGGDRAAAQSKGPARSQPAPAKPPAARQTPPTQPPHVTHPRVVIQPVVGGVYTYPSLWGPYDYGYSGYGYPYSYGYSGPDYCAPPPIFLPADTLYGPEAMKRFMGMDQWGAPPATGGRAPRLGRAAPRDIAPHDGALKNAARKAAEDQPAKPAEDRATNQGSINLAWKFIGFGDVHFRNQKYSDANERYRSAVRAAPKLADACFRQGFALAAMGRYELAVTAIRKGLELKPDLAKSDFRLAELYGDNQLAKTANVDALAKAAEQEPHDAGLLFLLGVHLYFDKKADQAAPFFKRARELAVGDKSYLQGFLEE
jgi:tetratricopeptide (TPR) repeat protein